jgi:hypothetical protein
MKVSMISNSRRSPLVTTVAAFVLVLAANLAVLAQTSYKVGDRVDAEWRPGRWYTAKIIAVKDGNYTVRYELDGVVSTVPIERLRPVGGTAANTAAGPAKGTPKIAGAFPSLRGTAWKIDFGSGVTGTVFLFCKTGGRWEIVPQRAGSIGAVGRSYTVSGSTLTTVNADDGKVEKWKMNWKDGVLDLFDGKARLKLHYNGETGC